MGDRTRQLVPTVGILRVSMIPELWSARPAPSIGVGYQRPESVLPEIFFAPAGIDFLRQAVVLNEHLST